MDKRKVAGQWGFWLLGALAPFVIAVAWVFFTVWQSGMLDDYCINIRDDRVDSGIWFSVMPLLIFHAAMLLAMWVVALVAFRRKSTATWVTLVVLFVASLIALGMAQLLFHGEVFAFYTDRPTTCMTS
ncbi:hypothetical protein [Microbacterium halotolerans]|uniref:hypothetical protein n=1 Tax=Microbacterium halotolerans TaxID=246613 RepID=UPI000E6AAA03|nr:hypothetical protein [Microbacterium halotolerans]